MPKNKLPNDEFSTWLQNKLKEINTDPDIFGSYIIGILDGDETLDEKREALNDILSEIINNDLDALVNAIFEKWEAVHPKEDDKKPVHIDVNEQLAKLLEAQTLRTTVKEREYTEEERRVREHILAQYSQTEVEDEDAFDSDEAEAASSKAFTTAASSQVGLERNTNVSDVIALQKEKREQSRQDSAAKKQKDKEDRERQKQLREEKKEKRKTVKGERRR